RARTARLFTAGSTGTRAISCDSSGSCPHPERIINNGDAPGLDQQLTRRRRTNMPQYLYQVAYTSESLAAQIKNPQDRLQLVSKQIADAVGAKIIAGGYSYGEYDVSAIVEAPDDVTMAAVALAIAAGGGGTAATTQPLLTGCAGGWAVKAAKTTPCLTGAEWVAALKKAPAVSAQYRPAR